MTAGRLRMAENDAPRLAHTTGDERADGLLRALVAACEAAFPGRIRSYLLSGSYAEGDPIPESDLDLGVLFRERVTDGEGQRLHALVREIEAAGAIRLDAVALDEEHALSAAGAGLPEALLIYGEDVRGELTLEPLAHALARHVSAATFYIWQLRGLHAGLVWPLDYPDPGGEFYGYERYAHFNGDDAPVVYTPGIRAILNCATMIATARLTHAGQLVPSKRASVQLYQAFVPDASAAWLADLYTACKARWRYHIPSEPGERAAFRALCAPMLAFENDFLAFARPLTEAALRTAHDDYGWPYARDRLRWIAYPDLSVS
jgi:predicted nucleotidyltransferase